MNPLYPHEQRALWLTWRDCPLEQGIAITENGQHLVVIKAEAMPHKLTDTDANGWDVLLHLLNDDDKITIWSSDGVDKLTYRWGIADDARRWYTHRARINGLCGVSESIIAGCRCVEVLTARSRTES